MSDKLEYIRDLLKACFAPELKQDLDSIPINSEHFGEYRKTLEQLLPSLYDFVQQNEQWLYANDSKDAQEVLACLIVLLSEITAPVAIYKLNNENLLQNANRLLRRNAQLQVAVEQIIFTHYQTKLHKNCWKRQLGTVHGFSRFLENRYNETTRKNCKMSTQWLTFCLSVGLTVRDCAEPAYKQIGTRIFQMMLHYGNNEDIQELNIHSVIFDAVFKDVYCMDSVVATADIWSCLCKCLDYFPDIDSLSWNQTDDMMEILLRNITLATDNLISICLLKFVTKLGAHFSINRSEIERKYNADLRVSALLNECRNACAENTSYTSFRWAKSILNMFVIESHKLLQSSHICRQLLQEIHRCYMVCILPITLQVSAPHLVIFYEKFTAVLMQVIVAHKQDKDIVKLIKCIIETFQQQLQHSLYVAEHAKLLEFRQAFEGLLEHAVFVQ